MKYRLADGGVAVGDVTRRTIYDPHAQCIGLFRRSGETTGLTSARARARGQMALEYRRFRRFVPRARPINEAASSWRRALSN